MLKGKIEVLFGHLKKKFFGKNNKMCHASSVQLVIAKFSKPLWNAFGFQMGVFKTVFTAFILLKHA